MFSTEWADVTKNLNTIQDIPELTVRITQTVSAYNYIYLDEFLDWASCSSRHEFCLRSRLFAIWFCRSRVSRHMISLEKVWVTDTN